MNNDLRPPPPPRRQGSVTFHPRAPPRRLPPPRSSLPSNFTISRPSRISRSSGPSKLSRSVRAPRPPKAARDFRTIGAPRLPRTARRPRAQRPIKAYIAPRAPRELRGQRETRETKDARPPPRRVPFSLTPPRHPQNFSNKNTIRLPQRENKAQRREGAEPKSTEPKIRPVSSSFLSQIEKQLTLKQCPTTDTPKTEPPKQPIDVNKVFTPPMPPTRNGGNENSRVRQFALPTNFPLNIGTRSQQTKRSEEKNVSNSPPPRPARIPFRKPLAPSARTSRTTRIVPNFRPPRPKTATKPPNPPTRRQMQITNINRRPPLPPRRLPIQH